MIKYKKELIVIKKLMPLKILTQVQSSDPQKATPCTKTSYDV